MSRELQDRGFQQSAYERPNQEWVCGWAAEGRPCPLGPDDKGSCVVIDQCTPSLRGDRWICARSDPFGGPCEQGPFPNGSCCKPVPPCQPKPSLRKKRGRLSSWVAGVTVALLALAITGERAHEFISPGPVSLPHGSIGECTECHAAGEGGAAAWFTASLGGAASGHDSERCLACHETNLGEFSRLPHSVSAARSLTVRERVASRASTGGQSIVLTLARIGDVPSGEDGVMACASCHKEHRGRAHDLRALSNDQCQVCHVKPFTSLADGHPAFTNYPYERRTRIQFNHVAHKNDAYPKKRAFRCQDCHEIDVDGQVMLLIGYEGACSGCHAPVVDTSSGMFKRSGLFPGNSADGVPFIALPGFDPDALEEAGVEVGQWPEDATFDLEDPLTPFMRLLLSSDEEVARALGEIAPDQSLTELDELEEDGLAAVGRIIWGVKELIFDIANDGQSALQERLEAGLGRPVTPVELSVLTANLGVEAVVAAERDWFRDLGSEVQAYRDGNTKTTDLIATGSADLESSVGWYRSGSFDLRYRPSGHEDPFLRHWLEVSLERNEEAPEGVLEALFETLAAPTAEGGCVKCHSVDVVEGVRTVNWHQKRRDLIRRGPNRFLHSPHMTMLAGEKFSVASAPEPVAAIDEANGEDPLAADAQPLPATDSVSKAGASCQQCHALVEDGAEATDDSFKSHDPNLFASSFLPIEKSTCASCHASGEENDSCLNCHNYHVGERIPTTHPSQEARATGVPLHISGVVPSLHPPG